jgi:hypothetical protein
MRAFARRKWPLATVLIVLLASGSAMLGDSSRVAFAKAALEDPLTLLADRSPGSRPEGAMFASKAVRDAVNAVLPVSREHMPPMAAELPVPDTGIPGVGPDPFLVPVQAGPPEAQPAPEHAALVPPVGPFIGGPGNPGTLIPIGGGPGTPPGTPPETPTVPEPPVVPAIPEPSTWALMIMGFFMVGATLRAKTAATAVHSAG